MESLNAQTAFGQRWNNRMKYDMALLEVYKETYDKIICNIENDRSMYNTNRRKSRVEHILHMQPWLLCRGVYTQRNVDLQMILAAEAFFFSIMDLRTSHASLYFGCIIIFFSFLFSNAA